MFKRYYYLQQWLRNTFGFSYKEIRGFWVIMLTMPTLLLLPWILEKLLYTSYQETYQKEQAQAQAILTQLAQQEKQQTDSLKATLQPDYQPFNPNEIDSLQWISLGASPRLAARIVNFVQKGGKFKKKEDLLRIYGFPEELYQNIAPWVLIPEKIQKNVREKKTKNTPTQDTATLPKERYQKKVATKTQHQILPFDLNQADTSALIQIKGVGLKTATQIIKYREQLGGFANLEQLNEVFVLKEKPNVVREIQKYAFISPNSHRKINLNTASFEELKAHPYIGTRLASILVNYRKNHGKFTEMAQLKNIKAIDEAKIEQLKPYLLIE